MGESVFRSLESHLLQNLLKKQPGVLATGGGTLLKRCNRQMIGSRLVIFLESPDAVLWQRIQNSERPLLSDFFKLQ